MITKKKYLFCLWKSYFETGWGLTSIFKFFISLFAIFEIVQNKSWKITLFMGLAYVLLCFLVGWLWFHFNFQEAQQEVSNRYNLFVKEMRKDLSKSRKV